MKRPRVQMSKYHMVSATERARSRVNDWIKLADDVEHDTKKEERLCRQECKACFYSSRIGGAAITEQPCMCCGTDQMYASTNTDALCIDCAREHNLCKHCGGDIELRVRRKQWPEPLITDKKEVT